MRADDEFFDDIGVTDTYHYLAEVPPTEAYETYVGLYVDLLLFTDRPTAETYLETAADDWIENWVAYYQDIEIVDDAEELGDDSAVVSFRQETTFGELAKGYRYWVRVGDRVAAVDLDGIPEITLPVAQKIAEAQLACFDDGTAWSRSRCPNCVRRTGRIRRRGDRALSRPAQHRRSGGGFGRPLPVHWVRRCVFEKYGQRVESVWQP